MLQLFDQPPSFYLPNLCAITGSVFKCKPINPHAKAAAASMEEWFLRMTPCDDAVSARFLRAGNFEVCAGLGYPDADLHHLETGLAFLLWAFVADDVFDDASASTEADCVEHEARVQAAIAVLKDCETPTSDPFAAMLQDIMRRVKTTATPGNCARFLDAYLVHSKATIEQSRYRSLDRLPSVEEFVIMRRGTISGALVEATAEYALDIDLPDYVFADPVVKAMSEAVQDIVAWPNDLCSFNKEQAEGDFQNLVCVVMAEHNLGVQGAIDFVAQMLADRVREYAELKTRVPSFGSDVDAMLAKYHEACENFVQAAAVWYSSSRRYFREGVPSFKKDKALVTLYPSTAIAV